MTEDAVSAPRVMLRGDHNQCPSCGLYFNSVYAFETHRTGEHGRLGEDGRYLPSNRHCLTIEQMIAKGMGKNKAGWWISKAKEGPFSTD